MSGDLEREALAELSALVEIGPRFHGTEGIRKAATFLSERLEALGLEVRASKVRTTGWDPGGEARLVVTEPIGRDIPCWPMLWSGSAGELTAWLRPIGPQGLWADAMVWTKFAAIDEHGSTVAYLHGRDGGPAAPQPLPIGSDESVPHLAIGRVDAMQLSEWIADGHDVRAHLDASAAHTPQAVSENLTVRIPGAGKGGPVLVCGHYDTFWNTPGAYDNGSGTIALLLLARHWVATPPERPVEITFFTAEEWHLAGSRALVSEASRQWLEELDFVINLDGLGRGDLLEVFIGPERFEDDVIRLIRAHGEATRDALEVVSRFPPSYGTDHASFYAAGVPSVHLTFNDLHRLHQPDDLPNEQIASNIAWTVGLTKALVDRVARPARHSLRGITMPF